MTYRSRALSPRRWLAAVLAAAALAVAAALPGVMRAEAVEVPQAQYRDYYSSSSHSTLVGQGMWTCQFTYVQFWGKTSAYYVSTPIDCDNPPPEQRR